jgi:uncharacterized lipoprotein YajG
MTLNMFKLTGLAALLVLLTACAGRDWDDQAATRTTTTSSTNSNSGSSVEVYGVMDAGVGVQRMSR